MALDAPGNGITAHRVRLVTARRAPSARETTEAAGRSPGGLEDVVLLGPPRARAGGGRDGG